MITPAKHTPGPWAIDFSGKIWSTITVQLSGKDCNRQQTKTQNENNHQILDRLCINKGGERTTQFDLGARESVLDFEGCKNKGERNE